MFDALMLGFARVRSLPGQEGGGSRAEAPPRLIVGIASIARMS